MHNYTISTRSTQTCVRHSSICHQCIKARQTQINQNISESLAPAKTKEYFYTSIVTTLVRYQPQPSASSSDSWSLGTSNYTLDKPSSSCHEDMSDFWLVIFIFIKNTFSTFRDFCNAWSVRSVKALNTFQSHGITDYWHDTVVCLSVRPWRCAM